ncbi:MAG: amidohydrolase family protein [bacterium]|nr:amidohydrolase family protein [bacterium]
MVIRGKIPGTTEVTTIEIDGGTIRSVGDGTGVDLGGDDVWVAPTIFDVQVNGVGGINYKGKDLTVEKIVETTEWMYKTGTGMWCPTVTTSSAEDAINGLKLLAQSCQESDAAAASFAGFHVEGPYIASEDGPRGAHPLEHTRDPDWDEFCRYQEAAEGRIRIFTLAPERDGALEFIEKVAETGVIVSIGHSGATPERIQEAIRAGAKMSTHLGNGAHAMLPRHPNYIWEQLAADGLWAGMIPDGFHLPEPVLKCFYRAKGKDRICLVSDVASIAGLAPGVYGKEGGLGKSELHANGKISLAGTPYLAGASLFLDSGIANVVRFTDASLADAMDMVTCNPARLLGIDDRIGTVEAGKEASLTLFRWEEGQEKLDIVATVVRGEVVYRM